MAAFQLRCVCPAGGLTTPHAPAATAPRRDGGLPSRGHGHAQRRPSLPQSLFIHSFPFLVSPLSVHSAGASSQTRTHPYPRLRSWFGYTTLRATRLSSKMTHPKQRSNFHPASFPPRPPNQGLKTFGPGLRGSHARTASMYCTACPPGDVGRDGFKTWWASAAPEPRKQLQGSGRGRLAGWQVTV